MKMTRDEVISLLQKGETYSNYYYCPNILDTELKTEYYIKDNVVVCYVDGKLRSWTDLNNRETIHIWNMGKEKLVATITSNINVGEHRKDIIKTWLISSYIGDCDRNVKLDVVTDEDVKRPDLNDYEAQKYN